MRANTLTGFEGDLPFVSGSETSREAAESMREVAGAQERAVFGVVAGSGSAGMTCDEVEAVLGLKHQSASARMRALAKRGAIVASGQRRATRSGRSAEVWTANNQQN